MSPSDENAASLIAALDRGESLPARWYTDPAITEREIQRAKNNLRAQLLRELSTTARRADVLGNYEMLLGSWRAGLSSLLATHTAPRTTTHSTTPRGISAHIGRSANP